MSNSLSRAAGAAALVLLNASCAVVQPSTGVVPGSESWSSAPPLLHPRSAHAVVSTPSGIYVIGGTGAGGQAVKEVERFDGQSWREETVLPGEGLNAPVAAVIGSRIYVIGGFKTVTNVPTSEVLVYDISSRTWSTAAPLAEPRGGDAAAVLNGRIHVIGGGNSRSTLANHSEYDAGTNTWTERAPLSRSKGSPAAVVLDGKLYSIGGRSGPGDFGDVEIYDPASDKWTPGPPIEPRGTAGAAVYCGTIYVFGGESQAKISTLDEVLRMSKSRDSWERATPMRSARNYGRAVVYGGSVYVIGGNPAVANNAHSAGGSTLVERFTAVCR